MDLKIRERLENIRRVLSISKKPTREEFEHTAKITIVGIALVGVIGFIFYTFSILFLG